MRPENYRQVVQIIEESTVGLDQDAFFFTMQQVLRTCTHEHPSDVWMVARAWVEVLFQRFPEVRERIDDPDDVPVLRRLH